MSAIIRSLVNHSQTLDSVALAAWAQQTRQGSTAALVAAVAAGTIQMVVTPEDASQSAGQISVYKNTPVTTDVYTVPDDAEEVLFKHAATIAALTVHMPVNPYPNQTVALFFKSIVTALTLDAATATVTTTVQGALTAATAAGFATYRYDAADAIWYRIG